MKNWAKKALELLEKSVTPPRSEMNELDWKISLSEDRERITEHLSAFANYAGGGFMVFGVSNSGQFKILNDEEVQKILTHLSNVCREGLEPPITIDYSIEEHAGFNLLFIHVLESPAKPVCIRGKGLDKAFIRCGGSTRIASRNDLKQLLINSHTVSWEGSTCSSRLSEMDLIELLKVETILKLASIPKTSNLSQTLEWMVQEGFVFREPSGGGYITNLGAITAARKLSDFPSISRKAIRVIVYDGLNKNKATKEIVGGMGYAVGFEGLLKYVKKLLPTSEVIGQALRIDQPVYPEVALREIIANALIHQDFSITGTGPLIEIYDDRIEITNPGSLLPSKQPDRLIGTQPESRNQELARRFRMYKICEERGSGISRAVRQVELYGLPPIEFHNGPNYFKVTLYSPRNFSQMSQRERLQACFQHAALRHLSSDVLTNKSLRERLKMPEKQRSLVSILIKEAVEAGLIKRADPENTSSKFAEYVPYWA